ncbi:glycosyltransferase [Rugamonas sp. CCM 8940]|uniref:glycosyltransferase n=1 Tax=Rugamonas sp. CCM 8940 TaxID=2765359 RepID=UPI0018F4C2BA|nr:glycosyltransferase [Rugamonas sp. CCM 8940]MBJ7310859.1 glycosyltransferase [Rugamonas sp. CCM 8940]
MVKRVLMVAFHFPPMGGDSGVLRTLNFARHLPAQGWQPLVLSARAGAYPERDETLLAGLDPALLVRRSLALDATRHLALAGRPAAWLAQPDRWISWWLSAVPAGLRLIQRHRPQLLWSSHPITSAHLVALALHRLTGIPWVADQRVALDGGAEPQDERTRRIHLWLERQLARHCAAIVCSAPGALRDQQRRFPELPAERLALIADGYDEADFAAAQALRPAGGGAVFRLLHSGRIYPSGRDPRYLFAALERLQADGELGAANFRLVLRGSGHDDYLRPLIARFGIASLVELAPPLPYHETLAEMLAADGLLLLQASSWNARIPAKLYEYLRAARPVLALADPAGDTAGALRQVGIDTIGMLDSSADIASSLLRFLRLARQGQAPSARPALVARQQRAARAQDLAGLFDRLLATSEQQAAAKTLAAK